MLTSLFVKQKKWKSIFSIVFFILVLLVNFVVISFGTKISPVMNLRAKVIDVATQIATKDFKIEDIYFTRTRVPQNYAINLGVYATNSETPGLRFESLTPEVFVLAKNSTVSTVKSKLFDDNEEHVGILRVTSIYDKSFVKDVEITFYKSYNKKFKAEITRTGGLNSDNRYILYKDSPFTFDYESGTSKVPVQYTYDENMFYRKGDVFTPKTLGNSTITIKYMDKVETCDVVVQDNNSKDSFNRIQTYGYPTTRTTIDPNKLLVGTKYTIFPMNGDDKLFIPLELTCKNSKVTTDGYYFYAEEPGTYTIKLKCVYGEMEQQVTIGGTFEIPYIYGHAITEVDDGYELTVTEGVERWFSAHFYNETSDMRLNFEYNKNDFYVGYTKEKNGASIKVITNFVGEKSFNIVVGKGTENETKLKVNVKSESQGMYGVVSKLKREFVKAASHLALYFVLGIALVLLYLHAARKLPLVFKIAVAIPLGIGLGALEEWIQTFEPGRFASTEDVFLYDFAPYVIGILLTWAVIAIVCRIRYIKKKKTGLFAPYVRDISKN